MYFLYMLLLYMCVCNLLCVYARQGFVSVFHVFVCFVWMLACEFFVCNGTCICFYLCLNMCGVYISVTCLCLSVLLYFCFVDLCLLLVFYMCRMCVCVFFVLGFLNSFSVFCLDYACGL